MGSSEFTGGYFLFLRRKTSSGRGVERKKEKAGMLGLGEKKKENKLPDCQRGNRERAQT
jgi:hypothetical protein